MYRAPNRPKHEITQSFNSGLVTICAVRNIAEAGFAPQQKLQVKSTLRYEELRVGLNRYYTAKAHNVQIEKVIRCPRQDAVSTQDIAITQDGQQFIIEQIQTADKIYPPSMDLTLAKLTEKYEVMDNDLV